MTYSTRTVHVFIIVLLLALTSSMSVSGAAPPVERPKTERAEPTNAARQKAAAEEDADAAAARRRAAAEDPKDQADSVSASVTTEAVAATRFGMAATISDHSGEIIGTTGDDVIIGNDLRNIVYGEGGTDRICTGGGDDDINTPFDSGGAIGVLFADGGAGNDDIDHNGDGASELIGGGGDDYLDAYWASVPSVQRGGSGNDYMDGTFDAGDDLRGEDGNDELHGYDGDDSLAGGRGRDQLYGDGGFDSLDGGSSKTRRPGRPARIDRDLCQVGPGGGTTVNCEREV
jgi:hypothetical protein